MPAITPVYGFPFQTLTDPPDGPNLGEDLALAVEAALRSVDLRSVQSQSDILVLQGLNPLLLPWKDYTPLWQSNGTQPAIGNGTLAGRYVQVGKTVLAYIKMTVGTTSTLGTGIYAWTLPVASRGTFQQTGSANVDDAGTALYIGNATSIVNAGTVGCYQPIAPTGSYFDPSHPMSWNNGDFVQITIVYEAA